MSKAGPHWYPAYVGLGSNLHGPQRQIGDAFELLGSIANTRLIACSALYRSAPFGGIEQPDFINAAAALLTQLPARELLRELRRIETEQGRERNDLRWGPRILDLDLLVYSTLQSDEPQLTVPHPGIAARNFVLLPLQDIAPGLNIPGLGPIKNLSTNLDEPGIARIKQR